MSILGFSSGAVGRVGNVDRMVQALLEKSGGASEFVKLTNLQFSGCKGCVDLCAKSRECRLDDEAMPYYARLKKADAIVLGAPVYFGAPNATLLAFLERFFGYRHVKIAVKGKPVAEVKELFERFHSMVTGKSEADDEELGKLGALSGVRDIPIRVKCATLAWHTLQAALKDDAAVVSTE